MVRAARMDRSFYTSLLFDEYATGNAIAIVVLVFAIPALVDSRVDLVFTATIGLYSLIRAGLSAVAAWAVAARVMDRDGRIPTTFRLAAFAHVAFIPLAIRPFLPDLATLLLLGSLAWYFVLMRVVAAVQFDLDDSGSLQVAAAGAGAWFLGLLFFPIP